MVNISEKNPIRPMEAVDQSVRDLQAGLEAHYTLLARILDQGVANDRQDKAPWVPYCPQPPRETRLREAIREAIEELEQSRKAFKSKRLEALRKKLTDVLIETR